MRRYWLTGTVKVSVEMELDAKNKEEAIMKAAEDVWFQDTNVVDNDDIDWDGCTEIEHA